jgi:predicted phage tail protein
VPPAIGLSPTSLSFTAQQGSGNPAAQTVTVSNTGGGTLTWAANDTAAWLALSPASGSGNGALTLTATTGSLTAGSYSGSVTVSATGANPVTIPVAFTVTPAPVPPAIGLSPTSLSFTAQQGSGNPAAQTVTVSNTGGGSLNWSVSHDATWLSHTPNTGTGPGTVTIGVNTGTLTAGTYSGQVTLWPTGGSSVTVPVSFTVTAPPPQPTISFSPSSLGFSGTVGSSNPASKTIVVTNSGTGTLTWTATDNASWLTVSQSGSSLVAAVNTAGLAAGNYSGVITITATGATNTPRTVPVTLTLTAPTQTTATLSWQPNTEADLAGYKVYRATSSGAYGAPIATLQGNVTQYVSSGLQLGTTYFFVVTAYDREGNESAFSVEVSKSIY